MARERIPTTIKPREAEKILLQAGFKHTGGARHYHPETHETFHLHIGTREIDAKATIKKLLDIQKRYGKKSD